MHGHEGRHEGCGCGHEARHHHGHECGCGEGEHQRQNPTSGGGVAPKTRTLYAGDRLDLIAWEEYGDSTRWRLIADANGLLDPLRLQPGRVIVIPPLE